MAEIVLEKRTQYESFADQYDTFTAVPQAILEGQFVAAALTSINVKGKTVLDLGGGSGIHARQAIDAGATLVDLVDISPEMVKIAQAGEEKLGRKDSMRFFIADCTQDLKSMDLGLHDQYDVVMVGWLFDHSTSNEDLHAFFRNVSAFAKPGGSLLNIRTTNPRSSACTTDPKYGTEFRNIREIPGGVAFQVYVHSDPPFEFEGTVMEKSWKPHNFTETCGQYGFQNVTMVDPNEMEVVRKDPVFWEAFINDPFFGVAVARKK